MKIAFFFVLYAAAIVGLVNIAIYLMSSANRRKIILISMFFMFLSVAFMLIATNGNSMSYKMEKGIVKQRGITEDVGFQYVEIPSGKSILICTLPNHMNLDAKKEAFDLAQMTLGSSIYKGDMRVYADNLKQGDTVYVYHCKDYWFDVMPKPFTNELEIYKEKNISRDLQCIKNNKSLSNQQRQEQKK